ncbi:DUF742 domain-containing protein [Actinocorallia libanotica]|uniref:DUF742 domain-containing protein n=1 Tax=Actinocorallia libanotica TaxID=46162 RepID=A0ABP4BWF2_9ACTN
MIGDDGRRRRPVPTYVVTGGRTLPTRNALSVHTLLIAVPERPLPPEAGGEQRALVSMCAGLLSVAEAAAHLELPVSVVTVLASDLVDSGHLHTRAHTAAPSRGLLEEVLHGLQQLR